MGFLVGALVALGEAVGAGISVGSGVGEIWQEWGWALARDLAGRFLV